jgi:hypothetical protein
MKMMREKIISCDEKCVPGSQNSIIEQAADWQNNSSWH